MKKKINKKQALSLMAEARKLSEENYSTWGQYIVEATTDEELVDDLQDHTSLKDWVDTRERVADVLQDREAAAKWMWGY